MEVASGRTPASISRRTARKRSTPVPSLVSALMARGWSLRPGGSSPDLDEIAAAAIGGPPHATSARAPRPWLDRRDLPVPARQRVVQAAARADPQLGEHLAQVPFDRA